MWRRSKPECSAFAGLIPVVTVFSPGAVTAATLDPGTSKAPPWGAVSFWNIMTHLCFTQLLSNRFC
jgi:hypothetical protein